MLTLSSYPTVFHGRGHLFEFIGRPVYLATPYSAYAALGDGDRAEELAAKWVARIAEDDVLAVSPVILGHRAMVAGGASGQALERRDHGWWMRRCLPILHASRALVIADIDGWDESEGIEIEVRAAAAMSKPIVWLPESEWPE